MGVIIFNEAISGDGFCQLWYSQVDRIGNPVIELSRIQRDWVNVEKFNFSP